mgnify:CR=1 FL=1
MLRLSILGGVALGMRMLPDIINRRQADPAQQFLPFGTSGERLTPDFLPIGGNRAVRQTSSTHGPDGYITADPELKAEFEASREQLGGAKRDQEHATFRASDLEEELAQATASRDEATVRFVAARLSRVYRAMGMVPKAEYFRLLSD